MNQANSAEEYKLVSSFEAVRKTLMQEQFADRLDKPLAYWALPNDRRLPLAFLGRSVRELLETPFNELSATRGIGQKKISSLVKLLHRATNDSPPAVPFGLSDLAEEMHRQTTDELDDASDDFDPSLVSEALWVQWRETMRKFDLGDETLGRLAPSLKSLPTVIWSTSVGEYLDRSIQEIRNMRTHGEKRVRVILEVFYSVHTLLANSSPDNHLAVRLVPKRIPLLERQIASMLAREEPPTREELRDQLAIPLLEQTLIDSGDAVYQLATERLGIFEEPKSVRVQSREMGVTRARVYQLLEDCGKVMEVRWPNGRDQLVNLSSKLNDQNPSLPGPRMFKAIRDLFFPTKGMRNEELEEGHAHEGFHAAGLNGHGIEGTG